MKFLSKSGIAVLFICYSLPSFSHPGIGIVKDSRGFIYYTDTKQVWRIDPATQNKTVVVGNVHTHELFMDAGNNLYGEHLWYNGEKEDSWGHYVWSLRSDGSLDTIKKPSEGFLEYYSFVRDSAGNMYNVQRFKGISRIQKINRASGDVTTLVEGDFKNVGWMYATPEGILYLVNYTDLYKVEKGRLIVVSKGLYESTSKDDHAVYGIWSDNEGNVYVAVMGKQVVKKVSPDGQVKDVAYSTGGWSPNAGVFDNAGNMWLMETNHQNEVQVRKIDKDTLGIILPAAKAVNKTRQPLVWIGLIALGLGILYLVVRSFTK